MILAAVGWPSSPTSWAGLPVPVAILVPRRWAASRARCGRSGPTWLQTRFEVPLLITTLLLNYVAALFAAYLVSYPFREVGGGVAQTVMIPDAA